MIIELTPLTTVLFGAMTVLLVVTATIIVIAARGRARAAGGRPARPRITLVRPSGRALSA